MKFTKMQAYGNDYVYIDAIHERLDNLPGLARFLSNRHFGVGSDGIVLICPSQKGDFRMRMFNPDGSEGEMCGNALRSMSMYVYEHRLTDKTDLVIETLGGMQRVKLFVENGHVQNIEANIGAPVLDTRKIPVATDLPEFISQPVRVLDREFEITAVSWGNPHVAMFLEEDLSDFDVERYGRAIENRTELFPNKTNVTFAHVEDRGHISIREWERNCGETIGCGTGCCTAVAAAVLTGRCDRRVSVRQIGGVLEANWDETEGVMYMKGPSHIVFESEIDVSHVTKYARTLKNLLEGVDYTLVRGSLDTEIADIKYDSRFVNKNDLFLARVGSASDSHDFIPSAVERGAKVVVIEKDVDVPGDVTVVKVASSKKALALMSAAYFGHPASELTTVGVTGTAGKTSTTFMLKSILERAGKKVGLIGTVGADIAGRKIELHNTTPESYEVQKLMRQMCDAGCEYAVMEVSSQGLKMSRVDGFTFDLGAFTNISPDHIGPNEHADFEEYLQCKSLLFQKCRVAAVNADDPLWEKVLEGHTCGVVTYGVKSPEADTRAEDVRFLMEPGFMGVEYRAPELAEGTVRVSVPGRFSVYNSLCAMTLAKLLKIDAAAFSALSEISVKGRMELVSAGETYKLIVDYAHNADEMNMLMETVLEYAPKRLVCVFGGGGNRARARRVDMGRIAGKHADLCILTEDNPRYEELSSINRDIIEGIEASGGRYITVDDRYEAIKYAIATAEQGDVILLIGKGHEQYQEVRGVRSFWDEREAVERAEKELQ